MALLYLHRREYFWHGATTFCTITSSHTPPQQHTLPCPTEDSRMIIAQEPLHLVDIFQTGGILAYPTEAVYGLGCDPDNEKAVHRLLSIKKRPIEKGLILIAADFSQVDKYLQPLSKSQQEFTRPSDTTYIFPALDTAPKWLTGDFNSLAIRITKHPLAFELCSTLQSALISTSANISGQAPAKNAQEVSVQLGDKIDAILDGKTGDLLKPTAIRDSISGKIIRP